MRCDEDFHCVREVGMTEEEGDAEERLESLHSQWKFFFSFE